MDQFLAIISPVEVSNGVPTHPIVIPPGGTVPPLDIWGDIEMPAHPIVIPPDGPPLVIWGDIETPEHPIELPPEATPLPPEVWPPGPGIELPEHPIVIPPGLEPPDKFTVIAYNPDTGNWVKMDFVPGGKPPSESGPKK